MCAPTAPSGAYKVFHGKTLPQAEFTSAEELKSVRGVPAKCSAILRGWAHIHACPALGLVNHHDTIRHTGTPFLCVRIAPSGAYKRFSMGKTLPQAEFTSAEELKSVRGAPTKCPAILRGRAHIHARPPGRLVNNNDTVCHLFAHHHVDGLQNGLLGLAEGGAEGSPRRRGVSAAAQQGAHLCCIDSRPGA